MQQPQPPPQMGQQFMFMPQPNLGPPAAAPTPDPLFQLPASMPAEAWTEFPVNQFVPRPLPVQAVEEFFLTQHKLHCECQSYAGVEQVDEVKYDPKSNTVGLWFDKTCFLRGVARIAPARPQPRLVRKKAIVTPSQIKETAPS